MVINASDVSQWILQSMDASNPTQQWQANQRLYQWQQQLDPEILLQLLHSSQEQVLFFALNMLPRVVLNPPQRQVLHQFFVQSNPASAFLRNKVASLIVHEMIALENLDLLFRLSPVLFLTTVQTLVEELLHNPNKTATRTMKDLLKAKPYDASLLQRIVKNVLSVDLSHSELRYLVLKAIKACFQWTDVESLVGNNDENTRMLFDVLVKSSDITDQDDSIQLAALEAWTEYVTSATITEGETSIQHEEDPKLPVLITLLQELHKMDVIPYAGESCASIEVVIQVAHIVNNIGLEVIPIWKIRANKESHIDALMRINLDMCFRAYAYDDIDVTQAILPLIARLTTLLDNDLIRSALPQMLQTLYKQMKYPVDFQYDYEDDNDAEEEMLRAELSKLFVKFVRAAPEVCLQFICEASRNALQDLSKHQDAEASLRLVYHFCEGIRPTPGLKTVMKNETFCGMLAEWHKSDIGLQHHRELICWYFDVAVRYYPMLKQKQYTPLLLRILEAMTGTNGLQHNHVRVRSRSSYLLLRLVKSTIDLMKPIVEPIVNGMLRIISSDNYLRPDDSLYLFESVGLLMGKTGLPQDIQERALSEMMTSQALKIDTLLKSDLHENKEYYGEILACSLASMAHFSKGFPEPSEGTQILLCNSLLMAEKVMDSLPEIEQIRNKCMVLLQRMILSIDNKCLPLMPKFLYILIEHCTQEDITYVAQLINQVSMKFRSAAIDTLNPFLLPFMKKVEMIVDSLNEGDENTAAHIRAEKVAVKKLAYIVLHHLVSYEVSAVLSSTQNMPFLGEILCVMQEGILNEQDPSVRRTCTRFFRELTSQWIDGFVGDISKQLFFEFLRQKFIPEIVLFMVSPNFDEKDAMQSRIIGEVSELLLQLKQKECGIYEGAFLNSLGRFQITKECFREAQNATTSKQIETQLITVIREVKAQ